jgi:hypothetical protein
MTKPPALATPKRKQLASLSPCCGVDGWLLGFIPHPRAEKLIPMVGGLPERLFTSAGGGNTTQGEGMWQGPVGGHRFDGGRLDFGDLGKSLLETDHMVTLVQLLQVFSSGEVG